MIKTVQFGRLQLTGDGYNAMETVSRELARLSKHMADKVKALGKRWISAVITEGQKLLSCAESTKAELMKSQKPKCQLFFNPLEVLKLDSPARCERLRSLALNKMILWAAAFAPSKSMFNFVIKFLEPGNSIQWPAYIWEILDTLALEQPLCHSSDFKEFLTAFLVPHSKLDKLLKLHP
ncbi:uncharacterized protein P174DRAFT_456939 [Aspergillus novofumigatus IBT 16806]|uniref:Uncharacterized protein n=1 Tax=Aspergillus novofumigatus (strain IBT 16806) TaxID=1392255 RepID=A0A2I1CPE8_ASPN1|nr:uncharacterized protein P174DRAFT_456939 [Aspergillus novofumigatus IBT 16806]PKX99506.1 hypothetical protein P174DRAFT_456939 [Aspergillus novofumigatus IBT 16806]